MPRKINEFLAKFKSPKNDDSNSFDVPKAILAFRTITSMLSLIQSPTTTTNTGQIKASREQRAELRVLDALSAVVVREHEVAAVMVRPFNGLSIEVLTSVTGNNFEPALTITQHGQSSTGRNLLRWLISPNPRDHSRNPADKMDSLNRTIQDTPMKLVDPTTEISKELSAAKESDLFSTFLQTQW